MRGNSSVAAPSRSIPENFYDYPTGSQARVCSSTSDFGHPPNPGLGASASLDGGIGKDEQDPGDPHDRGKLAQDDESG
jgi:hypothetical protein